MSLRLTLPLLLASGLASAGEFARLDPARNTSATGVAPWLSEGRYKLDTELGLESRVFLFAPLDPRQANADVSLRLQPEFRYEWDRDTQFTLTPFLRLDSVDDRRTHADIREMYLRHRSGAWEARAGVRKVFWGTIESLHLVDVLNQTDLIENPDTEDKLGQPMLDLSYISDYGTFTAFYLPYFRERTFPDFDARLRFPLTVATDAEPVFEPGISRGTPAWAARYSLSKSGFDLGLSHFSGTARAPRFAPATPGGLVLTANGPMLVPIYDQIDQTGLDANYVLRGWLLKLEAIHQRSRFDTYAAFATGFEYTFNGVLGSADVGVISEYLWDERGDTAPTPFNNDIFAGTRVALNDEASSELLAGVIVDADTQAVFSNIEASRRIGSDWKGVIEMRLFANTDAADPTFSFRDDDYISFELIRYFGLKGP
ncbi:MAG: hypothetical protein AABY95_05845 [Pseudomonadota bacterium]